MVPIAICSIRLRRLLHWLVAGATCALALQFSCARRVVPEPLSDQTVHMYGHFGYANQVQSAMASGELDDARDPARWLAAHEEMTGLPQGSDPYLARLRGAAALVVDAQDLPAAAAATAEIAVACGTCHDNFNKGPRFKPGVPPTDEGPGVAGHMRRHMWSADRMWEGLIGPSEAAWSAGARGLSDAPLQPTDLSDDPEVKSAVEELAAHVHQLGARAERTADPESRGELYGELLTTCSGCHRLVH